MIKKDKLYAVHDNKKLSLLKNNIILHQCDYSHNCISNVVVEGRRFSVQVDLSERKPFLYFYPVERKRLRIITLNNYINKLENGKTF